MGNLLAEFGNNTNWLQSDSQNFTGYGIPNYIPPYEFEKHILAIHVSNSEAKESWNFAGWVSQKIRLGVGPNQAAEPVANRKLWLRRTQLLIFQPLATTYTLEIGFPRWFKQASLTIWEYWGPQADSTENKIGIVQGTLIRLENKIDTLLQQHPP
ncbi:hypothetical protein [Microcoleus sp. D2_18a_B4]|uniref:hypothetical protein n=1 Tax=Microcoleus sp. D2_18a_B4 TaxID=3055329 RepID=UPI002FD52BD6